MTWSDTWRAPLYEALLRHRSARPHSFHVPGHALGQALEETPAAPDYQTMLQLDLTELSDTDDLHQPEGVILEAQQLAAATFGAEETCFLVGGSTSGNLALILAHCRPGDIILVQRNVHKSVIHGLQLARASAVFLSPVHEEASGLALIPSLSDLQTALQRYPLAKAVLLSNPNYYGFGVGLEPYVELVHSYGIPLLVDEAHGAHYGLHPELPGSALAAGADGVVQSTHKTLTAMTMGAMLHMQGNRIDRSAVRHMLQLVQSSSPSYPIMASLDIARAMIDAAGPTLFEPTLTRVHSFRKRLASETPFQAVELTPDQGQERMEHRYVDPLRATVRDRTGTLSGYAIQAKLEAYGCWAEMANEAYVVLIFGPGSTEKDIEALLEAFKHISEAIDSESTLSIRRGSERLPEETSNRDVDPESISDPIPFGIHLGRQQATEVITLQDAEGRMSAEMITPYPPGIPLVYAGERFTQATITRLQRLAALGAKCQGASDPTLSTVRVWALKTV